MNIISTYDVSLQIENEVEMKNSWFKILIHAEVSVHDHNDIVLISYHIVPIWFRYFLNIEYIN